MEPGSSPKTSVMEALTEIALNMRWSWNHAADELWSQLDLELWELTRNPWAMLQTVSREKLQTLSSDVQLTGPLDSLRHFLIPLQLSTVTF